MGTTVDEFIKSTDERIEKMRKEGRRKIYLMNMSFNELEINFLKKYYEKKGMIFESIICPRGLWDILITFY